MASDETGKKTPDDHAEPAHGAAPDEPKYWLDDMRNVNKIVYALYALSALLLVIDPLVPDAGKAFAWSLKAAALLVFYVYAGLSFAYAGSAVVG